MMIDWNDPAARARLIERLGPAAYNKAFAKHVEETTICVVNGYPLRPIMTRFGKLIQVYGDTHAFNTVEQATEHAKNLPPKLETTDV